MIVTPQRPGIAADTSKGFDLMAHDAPSLEALVDDLLARLGDAECVALLHQANPAMPDHGLGAFHTGAEALHGVAWLGTATVFPQPVGMAAAWDADLLREIGDAVGTELRAKRAADPTGVSLNCWAPVVNRRNRACG